MTWAIYYRCGHRKSGIATQRSLHLRDPWTIRRLFGGVVEWVWIRETSVSPEKQNRICVYLCIYTYTNMYAYIHILVYMCTYTQYMYKHTHTYIYRERFKMLSYAIVDTDKLKSVGWNSRLETQGRVDVVVQGWRQSTGRIPSLGEISDCFH